MNLEALLAYAHLVAILTWTVFLASTTALARRQKQIMNGHYMFYPCSATL